MLCHAHLSKAFKTQWEEMALAKSFEYGCACGKVQTFPWKDW
jgi:hypothetical protein